MLVYKWTGGIVLVQTMSGGEGEGRQMVMAQTMAKLAVMAQVRWKRRS